MDNAFAKYIIGTLCLFCSLTLSAAGRVGYATHYICKGDTYMFLGVDVSAEGTYQFSLKTVNNEDSTLYLTIAHYPTYKQTFYPVPTQGDTLHIKGQDVIFEVGKRYDLRDTLQTVAHQCDSIVRYVVNKVNPRTYLVEEFDTVPRDSVHVWHDKIADTSVPGTVDVYDYQYSIYGADSTIVLHLFVEDCPVHVSTHEFNLVWRQGHQKTWYIHHLSNLQPGEYTLTSGTFLRDSYGCDSLEIMHLTVLPRTTALKLDTICSGDTFSYLGDDYVKTGRYTKTIDNHLGGDSVITIDLFVAPTYNRSYNKTVVFGTDVAWADSIIPEPLPGYYTLHDTAATTLGCDSISHLTLTVNKAAQSLSWEFLYDTVSVSEVLTLDAEASSGLPVEYSVSNDAIAFIDGNTLSFIRTGVITITAAQSGDNRYNAARSIDNKLVIIRATGIEEIKAQDGKSSSRKLLIDGHLLILRAGRLYNALGQEL